MAPLMHHTPLDNLNWNGTEYAGGARHPAVFFSRIQCPPPPPQALVQLPPAKRSSIAAVGREQGSNSAPPPPPATELLRNCEKGRELGVGTAEWSSRILRATDGIESQFETHRRERACEQGDHEGGRRSILDRHGGLGIGAAARAGIGSGSQRCHGGGGPPGGRVGCQLGIGDDAHGAAAAAAGPVGLDRGGGRDAERPRTGDGRAAAAVLRDRARRVRPSSRGNCARSRWAQGWRRECVYVDCIERSRLFKYRRQLRLAGTFHNNPFSTLSAGKPGRQPPPWRPTFDSRGACGLAAGVYAPGRRCGRWWSLR